MRTITQSHKRQQRPVVLNCWIFAILKANPSFDLRAPRMMEVDNADKRSERNWGGYCRHITIIRVLGQLNKIESKPCARLAVFKSAGRGSVGGDDGSSAL